MPLPSFVAHLENYLELPKILTRFDLNAQNGEGSNALIYLLHNIFSNAIKVRPQEWKYLIENTEVSTNSKENILSLIFSYNRQINLSAASIDCIIKKK